MSNDRSGYQPKSPKKVLKEFYDAFKSRKESYGKYMKDVPKKNK
jgi:hypothetical protein